jgi:hypothetical protein
MKRSRCRQVTPHRLSPSVLSAGDHVRLQQIRRDSCASRHSQTTAPATVLYLKSLWGSSSSCERCDKISGSCQKHSSVGTLWKVCKAVSCADRVFGTESLASNLFQNPSSNSNSVTDALVDFRKSFRPLIGRLLAPMVFISSKCVSLTMI